MIAYFDTSALIPLVLVEPSSRICARVWGAAERVLSARVTYVEACAAIAASQRAGRITERGRRTAVSELDEFFSGVEFVEIDDRLTAIGADLAYTYGLRGYDAVQCAAGLVAASPDLIAVSGDQALLEAWSGLGLATIDVTRP